MKRLILLPFICLLIFGLAIDIFNPRYALIGDEYAFFYKASYIATHGVSIPQLFSQNGVYGYHPVADSVYQAVWMKAFGVNLVGWKSANIATLIISMLLVYGIALVLFKKHLTALTAMVFMGFSHYLYGFAHIGYNNLQAFLPFLTSILFYCLFLSTKKSVYVFLSGISAGACFYTFFAARSILIILIPLVIFHKKQLLVFVSGFLLLFLPFAVVNQGSIVSAMLKESVTHPYYHGVPWKLIGSLLTSLVVHTQGTQHHFVTTPLFSPLLVIAFFIGCVALPRSKKNKVASILCFIWAVVLGIVITFTYPSVDLPTTRLFIIIPALSLIAAYGVTSIFQNKLIISIILIVYILGEGYLFYRITPMEQPQNTATFILTLAQAHRTKLICIDRQLDDPPQLFSLYVNNIMDYAPSSSQSCDMTVFTEEKRPTDFPSTATRPFIIYHQ